MSKRILTENERKAKRDKALKPLPRCLLWAEAERLRGEAVIHLRSCQDGLENAQKCLFSYAQDPSRSDDDAVMGRKIYSEHVEFMERRTELAQRRVDHYTAEAKRLRAQAWEQGVP